MELKTHVFDNLNVLEQITVNTEHRFNYDCNDVLRVAYPESAEETTFVVAKVSSDDGSVSLPTGSGLLSVNENDVLALIPKEEYA